MVEVALGRYSPGVQADWSPSDGFDAVEAASRIPGDPNVWTDGILVRDQVTGVSSSGAGFFAHQSEDCWGGRRWSHVDRVRPERLVSLPISQRIARVVVGGVMLIVFAMRVRFCLAGAVVLFLGLFSQSKGLKCGVSFWLCSLQMLCIWGMTIWVWFVMLGVAERSSRFCSY